MVGVPALPPPPVPYHATAVRPDWSTLPAGLRAAVAARLGAPVVSARTATAGFTGGFAALLTGADGGRIFVKAADLTHQRHLADWYGREAAVLARLPAGLPVPRPRWALTASGWYALALDAVDGRTPRLPWDRTELDAVLAGYAELAAALADPPAELVALGLPHLADLARDDILWWGEVAAGREPVPPMPAAAHGRLTELVALESRLPGYAAAGRGLVHGDLRVDNVLLDAGGRAWFCDWNWICHGPAWFDLAGLLITGYADGLPVDAIFAGHPAAAGAPPDALDVTLAALAGYYLTSAAAGPPPAPPAPRPAPAVSPHLGAHQRFSGEQALHWLAVRQGWS
ncbi:Phosphotransferase enzyme family protein [Micromonospora purpureochromogenes]|uniref:Phosphotransferase enzyme family protein n=1 Tax=Micromonospora purpureochromogenes TaxID=47872 RepID=A0A1C4WK37_9ACTN|nr:aminoglycoside phosphotransferase family protein [Micromonospora purpureochromogenes]SCE96570.1 Phosphotransferase enzyme family protein [Micromonospora purpureochromogenes]